LIFYYVKKKLIQTNPRWNMYQWAFLYIYGTIWPLIEIETPFKVKSNHFLLKLDEKNLSHFVNRPSNWYEFMHELNCFGMLKPPLKLIKQVESGCIKWRHIISFTRSAWLMTCPWARELNGSTCKLMNWLEFIKFFNWIILFQIKLKK
jgi:hypothetical protein